MTTAFSPCAVPELQPPTRTDTKLWWAEALRQAFGIDILPCPWGARRQVIAVMQAAGQCAGLLAHLGLPADNGLVDQMFLEDGGHFAA